jgi:site-specific recombinase XerC
VDCGIVTQMTGAGRCASCYDRSPHRVHVRAANLAARLDHPPTWLGDLTDHLVTRYHPGSGCALLTWLGRQLTTTIHPQGLLDHAADTRWASMLEEFFTLHGLALPTDRAGQQAAGRRQRRVRAVPAPLRPAVAAFAEHLLTGRSRAATAGTKPRSHHTIDARLDAVRDLARFITDQRGKSDWATVNIADVEAFLRIGISRPQRLAGLRQFFAHATRRRLILINPTHGLNITQTFGFRGPTLTTARQRELFHRWTSADPAVHPHEAFVGLAALLHAATTTELCGLTLAAVDGEHRTIRLGRRPQPTPLDPWTWTALTACINHRRGLGSANPHLLITALTKATRAPASASYVKHTLDPVGIGPRVLRSTRLVALTTSIDPKLVATAYGMTNDAVTAYLSDRVDPTRIGEPVEHQLVPRT